MFNRRKARSKMLICEVVTGILHDAPGRDTILENTCDKPALQYYRGIPMCEYHIQKDKEKRAKSRLNKHKPPEGKE